MTQLRKNIQSFKYLLIGMVVTMTCLIGIYYWWQQRNYVSTDDAYVNANVVQIAPQVTGQVTQVYITNNQYVKKGQSLFDLDSIPYQIAVNEAHAQWQKDQAQLDMAKLTSNRTLKLVEKRVASSQEGDSVQAQLRSALAASEWSEANLDKAKLHFKYTKIVAPTSGWVTNVTLRTGNVVQANQSLFALISDEIFWVDANFKETEIYHIRPNQTVDVTVDMYPRHKFKGVVESISGGTGSAFSLLPPQNATGNWVKVTQRIPVRIRVIDPTAKFPLRIGSSATTTVNIHDAQHA